MDDVEWLYVVLDAGNWLACNTSQVSERSFSVVLRTHTHTHTHTPWVKAFRLLAVYG